MVAKARAESRLAPSRRTRSYVVRPGFRGVGFLGYRMLLSHQSNGRTAWAGEVIHQSFANEFWIWWRRGAAWRTSPGTLGLATRRSTAGATKTASTMDLRPA